MVKEVKWTKYLWLSLLSFGAFMLELLSIFATLDKGKHDKQQKNGLSTLPKTPPGCKKGGVFA